MKNITLAVLVFMTVCIVGCTTTKHKVTGSLHEPVAPEAIMIYKQMPLNSEVIGTISADSFGGATLDEANADALLKLRQEAGRLGANGVVFISTNDQPMAGAKVQAKAIYVGH